MSSSLPAQRQLVARLTQKAHWRKALLQQPPAALRRPRCPQNFSTSSRLLREQQPRPASAQSPTEPIPPPSHGPSSESSSPPPRRRPRWFTATIFLLLGLATGTAIRAVLSPPPPLVPGTKVDESLTRDIRAAAARLPLVKHLLADPAWSADHHEAYAGIAGEARSRRLTTGPLAGSRGVGAYQHIFHNGATGEVVAVVYLGTGTIGWPGVVHGGALATLLDEHSARAALKDLAASGRGLVTANLDITFKRPTLASDFYVVRARAVPEDALAPQDRGKRARKVWVDATVETLHGKTCVECRALFVAPKGLDLKKVADNF